MQLSVVRKRINWLLNAAVVLLVVVLVAVCLGLILSGAGDSAGSEAVRGLTYVALTVFVIDVLALLGHLTIAVVLLVERAESADESLGSTTESDPKSSS
ncbi:MAG: putative membrane protein [Planctomycetaceae bacterium]